MVNIRFQDNGSGIEERFHEVVFEPFRRLAGKHIEGSGMGLPICKRIVEKHGGSIRIETTNDNGTCFLISIPQN
jgi:signal transduction histidine kinase